MSKIKILLKIISILLTDIRMMGSLFKNIFLLYGIKLRSLLKREKTVIISLTEHLGDIIAAEPIAAYLKQNGVYTCWIIERRYASLTITNPAVDKTINVTCFSEWIILKYLLSSRNVYDLHINGKWCSKHGLVNIKKNPFNITMDNYLEKGNLLYAFSRSAGIEIDSTLAPSLYLKPAKVSIAGKYVVIHASSNQAPKQWKDQCWNGLAAYVLEHFDGFSVVEIGFDKKITYSHPRMIDETGEKELTTIAGLIQNSTLFIGIDSGFAHMTNALDKNSLILLGWLDDFKDYLPYSGKFKAEKDKFLVQHPGPLNTLPCDTILQLLKKYNT